MVMSLTLWLPLYYYGTALTVPVLWLIFYTLLLVNPLWMYELCLQVFVPCFAHYITISASSLFPHSSCLSQSVCHLFIAFMKPSLRTKLCQAPPPRRRILFAIVAKTDECYKNYIVWRMSGTYTVSWTRHTRCHFKIPSCFQSTCLTEPHLPIKPAVEYRTGSTVHIIVVLPLSAFLRQHPGFGTQKRNMSALQCTIINSLLKSH